MATCKNCFHYEACSCFKPTDLDKDVWHYCQMGIPEEIPDIDQRCDSFKDRKSWVEVVRCKDCRFIIDRVDGTHGCYRHFMGDCNQTISVPTEKGKPMSLISAMTMIKMLNETEKDLLEMNARMKKDRASATIDKMDFCGELCLFADGLIKKAKPTWIPVSERLPEVGQQVLCFDNHGVNFIGSYLGAEYKKGVSCFRDTARAYGRGTTHWMPLPEPPKE